MHWESRLSTDEQFSYRNWTLFAAIWCTSASTSSMSREREREREHLPCSQDKWPYAHKPVQLHSCLVSRHHLWTRQCLCLYAIHAQWIDDSSIRPLLVSSNVRRSKEIQTKKKIRIFQLLFQINSVCILHRLECKRPNKLIWMSHTHSHTQWHTK